MPASTVLPATFARAVDTVRSVRPRPEIEVTQLPAPQRLAAFAHAIGATVHREQQDVASGRLIVLYEPDGHEAWDGTLRVVCYVTAGLEPELATDGLLPAVGWSWLTDALDAHGAGHRAIGGTVTQTASTRFGALAGPPPEADIEIRASWTPVDDDLIAHAHAWYTLLSMTAGLPPPGVAALPERRQDPA